MLRQLRDISIKWDKPNLRSEELFNVPLRSTVTLKLNVEGRSSEAFYVVIAQPKSSWLSLSRASGKVPFSVTITVDTTGLEAAQGYKEILEFRSQGEVIYTEPVYLTTQVYDSAQLETEPYVLPINPGKPNRNPILGLLNGISIIYHLGMSVVYLSIGFIIFLVVFTFILAAFAP
jgi:hypothetical protein